MDVRKYVDLIEETRMKNGQPVNPPARKTAAIAVIMNPFANTYKEDFESLTDAGRPLSRVGGLKKEEISIRDGLR
jgi:hypothetical protein